MIRMTIVSQLRICSRCKKRIWGGKGEGFWIYPSGLSHEVYCDDCVGKRFEE